MSSAPYDDIDPIGEANDADRAEQLAPLEDDAYDDQVDVDVEADEADVAEQARAVPENEDNYPRS